MPRHPRLFMPEATYHVYCRVTRGEFVFDDPIEAEEFVSAVREVRDLHGIRSHGGRPVHSETPNDECQDQRSNDSVNVAAGRIGPVTICSTRVSWAMEPTRSGSPLIAGGAPARQELGRHPKRACSCPGVD